MPKVFTQNDYINAGRLQHKISHLRKLIESQRMSNERLCYRLEALNMVESIIDAQPKADVKRVRRGRWKCIGEYEEFSEEMADYFCENCGYVISRLKNQKPKFCEGCGADMREVSEDAGTD